MDEKRQIAPLEAVPEETTLLFRVSPGTDDSGETAPDSVLSGPNRGEVTNGDQTLEAIAVRTGDGVSCWLNYCQHLMHIHLDKGSGATMRDGELVCTNHGAYFEVDSGLCTFGPCEGAYLNRVDVTVADGALYLTDDEYEFVGLGGLERSALDRTSTSNVEF